MTSVEKAVIARIKKQGENFEILVNCDKAFDYKKGNCTIDDAIVTDAIFKDVKKGEHTSPKELIDLFGTEDVRKISSIIIKQGEIQLTSEHRNKLREEKRSHIISLIARNAVDPKTNLPHPPKRIENALAEAKVHIDEFKPAEEQIQSIIKQLTPILPISYEIKEISIKIPPEATAKSYSILKQYGKLNKEDWQSDGSLVVQIEVPAGLQSELFNELNKIAQGRIESKIVER